MPGVDPPEPRRQPVRAFIGRHQGLVGTALALALGGVALAAWHRWDLWWLENSLIQGPLIVVGSLGILALFIWAEGALPGATGARSDQRRSRAERETARPRGWRRGGGRSARRRRPK